MVWLYAMVSHDIVEKKKRIAQLALGNVGLFYQDKCSDAASRYGVGCNFYIFLKGFLRPPNEVWRFSSRFYHIH
jgi:hypothetical protein